LSNIAQPTPPAIIARRPSTQTVQATPQHPQLPTVVQEDIFYSQPRSALTDIQYATAARLVSPQYTTFKEGQQAAIEMVYLDRGDTMIVLPTGWGKTLVYAIQYHLPGYQGLTLILTPTNALRDDLLRRFKEYKLPVQEWAPDMTLKRGFVIVGTDRVSMGGFMRWCERSKPLLVSTHLPWSGCGLIRLDPNYRRRSSSLAVCQPLPGSTCSNRRPTSRHHQGTMDSRQCDITSFQHGYPPRRARYRQLQTLARRQHTSFSPIWSLPETILGTS